MMTILCLFWKWFVASFDFSSFAHHTFAHKALQVTHISMHCKWHRSFCTTRWRCTATATIQVEELQFQIKLQSKIHVIIVIAFVAAGCNWCQRHQVGHICAFVCNVQQSSTNLLSFEMMKMHAMFFSCWNERSSDAPQRRMQMFELPRNSKVRQIVSSLTCKPDKACFKIKGFKSSKRVSWNQRKFKSKEWSRDHKSFKSVFQWHACQICFIEFQQCQRARWNGDTHFSGSNFEMVLRFKCFKSFKRQQHISKVVKTWQRFQEFQERVLRVTAANTQLKFLPMLSVLQCRWFDCHMNKWHTISLMVDVMILLCQWSSLNMWHSFLWKNNKWHAHFKQRFDWPKIAKTSGVFGGLKLKSISNHLKFDLTLVQHIQKRRQQKDAKFFKNGVHLQPKDGMWVTTKHAT